MTAGEAFTDTLPESGVALGGGASVDFDGALLRGGAWATTGTGASVHYRLWFRRHFYQHAGFRLVRSAE